jgi:hypothetical protein
LLVQQCFQTDGVAEESTPVVTLEATDSSKQHVWKDWKASVALAYSWQQTIIVAIFEVFMVVTIKNAVFWDVTPCGSCKK